MRPAPWIRRQRRTRGRLRNQSRRRHRSCWPPATTEDTTATFTFSSDQSSATFECALDGAAFTDCESPVELTDLELGEHTFEVRAVDLNGLADSSPASHTWTVAEPAPPPVECNATTTTVAANADAWVDQGSPSSNEGDDSNLKVMSKSGANLRALVRFNLPTTVPEGCQVESATLRLYAGSFRTGRTVQALSVNAPWTENGVTWANQPATTGSAATTSSGSGYRQWDVTSQVQAAFDAGANHGFLIRDAVEGQDHEQQFHSRRRPRTTHHSSSSASGPADPIGVKRRRYLASVAWAYRTPTRPAAQVVLRGRSRRVGRVNVRPGGPPIRATTRHPTSR